MSTKAKATQCIFYTGVGAKPSGLHTARDFLATSTKMQKQKQK